MRRLCPAGRPVVNERREGEWMPHNASGRVVQRPEGRPPGCREGRGGAVSRMRIARRGGAVRMSIDVGQSAADRLTEVRLQDDFLEAGRDGQLLLEGHAAADLLARFGSPLYVVSEPALRANFRRIRTAFREQWPGSVEALYAIKSNNNLAIRRVLASEGAGSDCFGLSELYATFLGGADPDLVVLNGSNKSEAEL